MESIRIRPFSPELAPYFLSINKAWIDHYFSMEAFDKDQLENPQRNLIDNGGAVIFAEMEGIIVGTVALKKMEEGLFEMIKMGVIPEAQGKKAGYALTHAILDLARTMGGKKVVLYSNTTLKAAIHMYKKTGFKEVQMEPGKYNRCDIKMEVTL